MKVSRSAASLQLREEWSIQVLAHSLSLTYNLSLLGIFPLNSLESFLPPLKGAEVQIFGQCPQLTEYSFLWIR